MSDALIGHSGYVGSTLKLQRSFDYQFRSTNIDSIRGRDFNLVICAGAPAQKWVANREPEADRSSIENLISHISTISCNHFVLISTVDVFANPIEVDEDSPVIEEGLHPYGLHRRELEKFVAEHFTHHLIVRLPGLVGPGLKKNALFDLLHGNDIHKIDSRNQYQFYPMVNLWTDVQSALAEDRSVLHLTAPPISIADAAREGFGVRFDNSLDTPPVRYDFRTRYARNRSLYQYSRQETLLAIRAYAQGEVLLSRNAKCG